MSQDEFVIILTLTNLIVNDFHSFNEICYILFVHFSRGEFFFTFHNLSHFSFVFFRVNVYFTIINVQIFG